MELLQELKKVTDASFYHLSQRKWWLTVSHALDEILDGFNHFGRLLRDKMLKIFATECH